MNNHTISKGSEVSISHWNFIAFLIDPINILKIYQADTLIVYGQIYSYVCV